METSEFLKEFGYDDWRVDSMGHLICPHGYPIEKDGECPEGCVSPLRQEGII